MDYTKIVTLSFKILLGITSREGQKKKKQIPKTNIPTYNPMIPFQPEATRRVHMPEVEKKR